VQFLCSYFSPFVVKVLGDREPQFEGKVKREGAGRRGIRGMGGIRGRRGILFLPVLLFLPFLPFLFVLLFLLLVLLIHRVQVLWQNLPEVINECCVSDKAGERHP